METTAAKIVTVIPPSVETNEMGGQRLGLLRVAAYCRVSTKQEEQANSYETQVAYYTEKIHTNPKWQFAGIFADKGLTGTQADTRTDFMRMIRKCRQGKIDLILVKSVSRFARNTVDCLEYIRLLKSLNIGVYFEKESIDTLKMNSEMPITFVGAFSQSESESISGNVSWGIRQSFKNGKVPFMYGSLLGYRKGEDDEPEIIPEEAETVRRIYREFLAGKSLALIKKGLEADGIRSPRGKLIWRIETLRSILRNERYKGDALLQKTYKPNVLCQRAKKNEGELPQYYVSNNHSAIVEDAMFDRVQEELAKRASKRKTSEKTAKTALGKYSSKYALTELLVCGGCGSRYRRVTWARNGQKKIVWRCISRLDFGTTYCTDSPTLEERRLQEGIVRAISEKLTAGDEALEILKTHVGRVLYGNGDENLYALQFRIRALNDHRMELVRKCVACADESRFDEEFKAIEEEIQGLYKRLEALQKHAVPHSDIFDVLEQYRDKPLVYDDVMVRQLIGCVRVLAEDRILVVFKDSSEMEVVI